MLSFLLKRVLYSKTNDTVGKEKAFGAGSSHQDAFDQFEKHQAVLSTFITNFAVFGKKHLLRKMPSPRPRRHLKKSEKKSTRKIFVKK